MALDPNLLEKARTAGDRLAEAERHVTLARAGFNAAVRRVHLAGGSLREIAQALSLSHQRVQQIVRAAGGSWWMLWRNRRPRREMACTWCGRPASDVAKLIAGPKVYICDACVGEAERAAAAAAVSGSAPAAVRAGGKDRCAFCNKRAGKARRVVAGVCAECLAACREILDHSAI